MNGGFLGSGWSFPVAVKDEGSIAPISDEEKIRQSIRLILSTVPGERVMRPDFGCGIYDLIFEPLGDALLGRVADQVNRALALWEPRIDVLGTAVQPDAQEPELLLISIDYAVRRTNSRFNLVYPFYVR